MDRMEPPAPDDRRPPESWIPPRPDVAWQHLPPTVRTPRRRGGLVAIIAILTALGIVASLGLLGGVVNVATRSKGSSDEYRFLATAGGEPIRWNPCAPIHYVVNLSAAPDGSLDDVKEAIRRVSEDTGIPFVLDGSTTEIPQADRAPYQPTRYGDRWAPLVIAWAFQAQTNIQFQDGDERYAAVSRPLVAPTGSPQYVSGWVVVNAADRYPTGWSSPASLGPTVLHELGHIIGLDHVASKYELMEPSGGYMTDYGPGDLAGLERLGRDQGCLITPAAP
jgi:hypothetical protein